MRHWIRQLPLKELPSHATQGIVFSKLSHGLGLVLTGVHDGTVLRGGCGSEQQGPGRSGAAPPSRRKLRREVDKIGVVPPTHLAMGGPLLLTLAPRGRSGGGAPRRPRSIAAVLQEGAFVAIFHTCRKERDGKFRRRTQRLFRGGGRKTQNQQRRGYMQLTRAPPKVAPTANPAEGRMVTLRPSMPASLGATSSSGSSRRRRVSLWPSPPAPTSSPSWARMGVRLRGLDRGRVSRSGEGLPFRCSDRGEVAARPDRRTSGDECLMSSSMGVAVEAGAAANAPGMLLPGLKVAVVSRSSGMLSVRARLRGRGEAAIPEEDAAPSESADELIVQDTEVAVVQPLGATSPPRLMRSCVQKDRFFVKILFWEMCIPARWTIRKKMVMPNDDDSCNAVNRVYDISVGKEYLHSKRNNVTASRHPLFQYRTFGGCCSYN